MAKKAAMEMPVISATGSRGFTLMELLVVLTILVLMAGAWPFAAPRLFPAQQLRNEAQRFVSDVRAARVAARTTGIPQIIAVEDSGNAYAYGSEIHSLTRGVLLHVRADQSLTTTDRVMLYPDGSTSGAILDFSLPSRILSVSVGQVTGRAEILE
jgi:general secretion pathway protein H